MRTYSDPNSSWHLMCSEAQTSFTRGKRSNNGKWGACWYSPQTWGTQDTGLWRLSVGDAFWGQEILREVPVFSKGSEVKGIIMELSKLAYHGYGVPGSTEEMLGRERVVEVYIRKEAAQKQYEDKVLKEERWAEPQGQGRWAWWVCLAARCTPTGHKRECTVESQGVALSLLRIPCICAVLRKKESPEVTHSCLFRKSQLKLG